MEKRSVGRSFFSGVLILTLANLLVKVIGLTYKIPLTNEKSQRKTQFSQTRTTAVSGAIDISSK